MSGNHNQADPTRWTGIDDGMVAFAFDETKWERIARTAMAADRTCLCDHAESAHKDQRGDWTSCACGCLGFALPRGEVAS